MTSKNERKVVYLKSAQERTGVIRKELLITEEQMGAHCGLFGEVTIEPGAVLGVHGHQGETETYYITAGAGIYNDNGIPVDVKAGDVVFCEDGGCHGLENTGILDLTFIALILKK